MKAVVLHQLGGPEQLRIEQVKTPVSGPRQVRVLLRAAALNRRDVWITLGRYPKIKLPCILGSDGAGVINQVGADVDAQMLGREVIIYPVYGWGDDPRFPGKHFRLLGMPDQGTFAEFICVPVEHIFTKPAFLSWEQAAAIPVAGLTAWRAVATKAAVQAGESVLVTGIGGGVATFALKWALGLGAKVWVTSGDPHKLERAVALGAQGGVNYKDERWVEKLAEQSGGFDVIIDGTGGVSFKGYMALLNYAGRMVVYGATAGNPPDSPDMVRLFFRQVQIMGTTMGTLKEFAAMLDFLSEKQIKPVIDRVFTLDEAVAAHQYLQTANQMGKVILRQS